MLLDKGKCLLNEKQSSMPITNSPYVHSDEIVKHSTLFTRLRLTQREVLLIMISHLLYFLSNPNSVCILSKCCSHRRRNETGSYYAIFTHPVTTSYEHMRSLTSNISHNFLYSCLYQTNDSINNTSAIGDRKPLETFYYRHMHHCIHDSSIASTCLRMWVCACYTNRIRAAISSKTVN